MHDVFKSIEAVSQKSNINTDLPYNLNDNPKANLAIWQNLGITWEDPGVPISYRINEYGYRGNQFANVDWNNVGICIGDSQMFGTGLAESHTIPGYLSASTGIEFVNFGECNSSNTFMSEQSVVLALAGIKPKAVVVLTTSMYRTSWGVGGDRTHLNAWCLDTDNDLKFFNHWADNYNRVRYQSILAFNTIKSNWPNTPLAMLTYDGEIERHYNMEHIPRTIITNYARDGKHHSHITSKVIADKFLERLLQQNFNS